MGNDKRHNSDDSEPSKSPQPEEHTDENHPKEINYLSEERPTYSLREPEMVYPNYSKKSYEEESPMAESTYLATEPACPVKRELHHGIVRAMAGSSFNHQQISGNLFMMLRNHLKRGACHVFISEMKVRVNTNYYYPDVMVVCGKPNFPDGNTHVVTNPNFIVEVLSSTTRSFDLTSKFASYQQLPTLKEYLLVDQERVWVQLRRRKGGWSRFEEYYQMTDTFWLESLKMEISVAELYSEIIWEQAYMVAP